MTDTVTLTLNMDDISTIYAALMMCSEHVTPEIGADLKLLALQIVLDAAIANHAQEAARDES